MLYIFYGPDDFSISEKVERLKATLGDKDILSTSTSIFEGRQLTLKELTAVCDTTPFLSPKRLVIVRGILERFELRLADSREEKKQAENIEKLGDWSKLAEYVRRMSDSTVLILIDGEIRRNNPLLRSLSPVAKVEECRSLKTDELYKWVNSRVAENKAKISPEAAKLLIEYIGPNLWIIASEIDKLALFTRGRNIEAKDIMELVSYVKESSIFNMLDAIIEQRSSQALKVLQQLLLDGASFSYIITMIAWQLRLLISCRPLMERNVSQPEIQKALKLGPNYPVFKLIKNCRSLSERKLKDAYFKILEADVAIKTGKYPDELALEMLIAELSRTGFGR